MPKRGGGGGKRGAGRNPAPAPSPALQRRDVEYSDDEYYSDSEDGGGGGLPAEAMSVVKVLCTHAEPNYSLPWQMRKQNQSSSTGFIIDLKRKWILTNAHSVEHYTQV